jgi:hypothetical protein
MGRSYCWCQTDDTVGVRLTLSWQWLIDPAREQPAPAPPPTKRDPSAPLSGPADWPAVTRHCAGERWQSAYGAAHGCPQAATYIEARKAEALAMLTVAWQAARRTP